MNKKEGNKKPTRRITHNESVKPPLRPPINKKPNPQKKGK